MDSGTDERRRRPHVDHFRAARVADRPRATDDEDGVLVDLELGDVDATVIVLWPVENDDAAPEYNGMFGIGKIAAAQLGGDHRELHYGPFDKVAPENVDR